MREVWIIAKRELASFFDSLLAYILIVAFLGFSGVFTWLYSSDIFLRGQASLGPFFGIAYWTLFFFIPALTMRTVAEEKRSGTIELLLTKPITDWQLVFGKFLACFLLVGIALAFTIPYFFTVAWLGNVDQGAVFCGYLGLLLMTAAYIGIGIMASSITNNQIVAFLLALFISVFFQVLFGIFGSNMGGFFGNLFHDLSTATHFESISRGVIDSKDLIFFLSIAWLGIAGSEYVLSKRNATAN